MLMYNNWEGEEALQRLTIQIVTPSSYIEPLKEALKVENRQNYQNKLMFVFCEDVEESINFRLNQKNSPDYVAIVMDPTIKTCIETAEENITKIDNTYLSGGRICLVNGGCSVKPAGMGVGLGHINVFAQKYSVTLINGDVQIPEKCLNLASRISQLATSVCGFLTGVPIVIDTPGYEDV